MCQANVCRLLPTPSKVIGFYSDRLRPFWFHKLIHIVKYAAPMQPKDTAWVKSKMDVSSSVCTENKLKWLNMI